MPLWFDLDWLFICKIVSNIGEKFWFFFIQNSIGSFIHVHTRRRWYQRGIFVYVWVLFLFLCTFWYYSRVGKARIKRKKMRECKVANICWCKFMRGDSKWERHDVSCILIGKCATVLHEVQSWLNETQTVHKKFLLK